MGKETFNHIILLIQTITGISASVSQYFETHTDKLLEVPFLDTLLVRSIFDCQTSCSKDMRCFAINFAREEDENGLHDCEILPATINPVLDDVDGYDFFKRIIDVRTCKHAKDLGFTTGEYLIDPDGHGPAPPFPAFCNVTDDDGVTVISHDTESRMEVTGSCDPHGCYKRNVRYSGITDVAVQLGALADASERCEQFIRYESQGSLLMASQNNPNGWLVSRVGNKMRYWGGAPRDSKMCACGVTGTCVDPLKRCNADINSVNMWTTDEGMLIYKEDLPVIQLRFGDVASRSEIAFHNLGKLKCYGELLKGRDEL
ncbi:contactin-associated protein-like 2 isoform X2 [Nematostella vectensis]|uniref:contactin-associated protein-like 2 isoform X2 n=1 Tax=Nematostella vectensis TaxID=45351 RepID=UPI0020773D87|nr:contactin-associated protein-like 2 isoform X2 [Nematostella vectensis]